MMVTKKRNIMNKKGQQEMVGFVLIIVLVVVAMMIFLVISLKKPSIRETESLEVDNMLSAVMEYTTDCAVVFVPQYETMEDLFKSRGGKTCSNKLDPAGNPVSTEDYLNQKLVDIFDNITKTESFIIGYQVTLIEIDEEKEDEVLKVVSGDCQNSAKVKSAQRLLVNEGTKMAVRLKICEG